MPFPRNPHPSDEEAAEYAAIDDFKARIDQVTERRTTLVNQAFLSDDVLDQRASIAEARDMAIIHQSMLAELATME